MRRQPRNPVVVGAVALVVLVVAIFLAVRKDIPFVNPPYTISAAFRDSSGIKPGSPIRIAGVDVGKVSAVDHTSPGSQAAVVRMQITKNGRPVHRDARFKIRPRIFLEGNFFVDVQPGTPSAPELSKGDTVSADQTANPVQLDQVLKTLTSDVRTDLRTTFAELFNAQLAGGAKALNGSLQYQPAAYKFSAIVSEALLGSKPGDLGNLIRDQGIVSSALDRSPEQLIGLIGNLNRTAGALASRQADLSAAIDELPRTLSAALPTLAALNTAFPPVRRFARAALPGVRSTGPAVDALLPLVKQLRGLVGPTELRGLSRDLRAATPPLTALANRSVDTLGQLRALGSCATNVLVPFGNDTVTDRKFPAHGPVHTELPKSLVGLAGESRSFDANGQWFKVLGQGGLNTLDLGKGLLGTTSEPLRGVNPPPQHDRPPLRADVPCETQEPPNLDTQPGAPPTAVPTSTSSPAARERARRSREVAVDELRRGLKAIGEKTKVLNREATAGEIAAASRKGGR